MPSARELLAEADALMRRNRARAINTEIPELTEAVAELVRAPLPTLLADVPELTDAVEEIEIASIAEMPDDKGESSSWLHFDPDHTSSLLRAPGTIAGVTEPQRIAEPDKEIVERLIEVAPRVEETPAVPIPRSWRENTSS